MKKYMSPLILILFILTGFTRSVLTCPDVATYSVRGLYYGNFPVRVQSGSSWDVENALNEWESHINSYAGFSYNLFTTDDYSVPSYVTAGIATGMDAGDFGKTFTQVDPSTDQIKSFQSYWNNVTYTSWCFGSPEICSPGQISFRALITHETGHGIGLAHADSVCSCPEFTRLSLEDQMEEFPTMTDGKDGGCLYGGIIKPYILLHTPAWEDIRALSDIYWGVVSADEPFEYADIRNNELMINMKCDERDLEPAYFYISNNKNGPAVELPDNPYDFIEDGDFCGFRISLTSASSPAWVWYKFEGESSKRGPFAIKSSDGPPARTIALKAYPNPFNPSATFKYALDKPQEISLAVYNINGEKISVIEEGLRAAGEHSVKWDGKGKRGEPLPSATYIAILKGESFQRSEKLTLLK